MTRGQSAELGERVMRVETITSRLGEDIQQHSREAKAANEAARHDRQKIMDMLGDISKQVTAKDTATNARIDAYEAEARGGKKVLLALSAAWGLLTSSAGAALMYWLKSGSPMPPGR